MDGVAPTAAKSLKHIEWMWQSNPNPWSESELTEWSYYTYVENIIIEEAFSKRKKRVILDDYYVDFKDNVQISKNNEYNRRPIKRMEYEKEDKPLREERFIDLPITSKHSLIDEYGWVSPFIMEVRRSLGLKSDELPCKKPRIIPMLVRKAACGIIEEGKHIGKRREAKCLANMLREKKNQGIEEVWKCCAYLYTLESFLYKTLNATMRLVGDKEHEQVWRGKIRTLGPFCLLLWDDPFNKIAKTEMILYRGANLESEQITIYEDMAQHPDEYRSFQAFTSCTRNPQKAERFGNTLFIMKILSAFTADLCRLSEYPNEEEELLMPGVGFRVERVDFNHKTNKHVVYLELRQRWSSK
ncbi:unnamed protein product [Rotaria sp. Silwood2]|nr:unnamed protein product [Rotaria sp. Silwood2]